MGKPLLKTHSELTSVQSYGRFFKFTQRNIIGSRRTHFGVKRHVHLHALIENLSDESLSSRVLILVPYVKVGSTRALNKWDQSGTPPTTSFLKVPNKAFVPAILRFLLDDSN